MGRVPTCVGNGNSRIASCSQPSLHCQGVLSGRGAIKNCRAIKSAFISYGKALKISAK